MLFHYVPQQQGRPLRLPIAMQCFDRYFNRRADWKTEAGQIAAAEMTGRVGCDSHWLDAAWFELGFPNGVGNWYPDPKDFPRGLRPVGDACHRSGLRFILWFEPERVAGGSQIARQHREFVFQRGPNQDGLFKLSDPVARRWLTDLLSRQIGEFGLDVYRNDFNIDPLPFWREADAPDRQGVTEIRYIEGLYAMWDELSAGHPGLWIDNCASGGRRIDLETCMRSVPLWRSDTSCGAGHADWDQTQTQGLSLYIPLFTACSWTPDAYVVRSGATAGAICQFDYLAPDFPLQQAKVAVKEVRENQKYWYGDFYPLTRASTSADVWAAYQFHRPDLNAGILLAFRRANCNHPAMEVSLRAIDPATTYRVEMIDESRQMSKKTMTGAELIAPMELRLPAKASLLVHYTAAKD
jgi:alpha-galactosidase